MIAIIEVKLQLWLPLYNMHIMDGFQLQWLLKNKWKRYTKEKGIDENQ